MKWVNFKEIKKKVSIREVLSYYDAQGLRETGGKLIGPCPVHGGDSPSAFHVDLEKNIWHCFTGCKKGGNVLDLVAQKEGISIRDAALKLQDLFLSPEPSPPPAQAATSPSGSKASSAGPSRLDLPGQASDSVSPDRVSNASNPPLELTLNLSPDHPYLLKERGLKSETVARFGLGYCHQGILKGRIAIPIHDEHGQLVAYAGRSIKDGEKDPTRPKYKFPKGFHKQLVLYNLRRAREPAEKKGEIVLVEGFFDVFRLHEAGYSNVVALMGTSMSMEQEALLRASCSRVTLFLDGDRAGQDCAEECLWRLVHDIHVRMIELEEGQEPDKLSQERIKQLLG